MRNFCERIAKKYAEERIKGTDKIKQEELKTIKKYIKRNYKILDLCCGPGTFLIPLTKQGYDIDGVDFSKNMLKEAKKYAKKTITEFEKYKEYTQKIELGENKLLIRKNYCSWNLETGITWNWKCMYILKEKRKIILKEQMNRF